jgi:hypothetical protein
MKWPNLGVVVVKRCQTDGDREEARRFAQSSDECWPVKLTSSLESDNRTFSTCHVSSHDMPYFSTTVDSITSQETMTADISG